MSIRPFICFLFITPVCTLLCGQKKSAQTDVNNRTLEQISAIGNIGGSVYQYAAANAVFRFSESFTELGAGMNLRSESKAFLQAEGDGNREGAFRVRSHIMLGNNSVAFAGVSYANGKKSNVCWNSASDYILLYPYIQADSIGGDLQHETYRFYGGYCHRDRRFHYGINASYRALHEYRQVDPRPRNITADLSASLSGGYQFRNYVVSLSAGARIYKQTQNVAFYSDDGANTSELLMTGLGTFYVRYSGTDNTGYRYRGKGFLSAITVLPLHGSGWYAAFAYETLDTDRKLADINMVTLTGLFTQRLVAEWAYRHEGKTLNRGISLKGNYELRQGTEYILGSGGNHDNLPLGEQTMYTSHAVHAALEGVMEWKGKSHSWAVLPAAGFRYSDETYLFPKRKMRYSLFHVGADASYTGTCKDWLFRLCAGGVYEGNISGVLNVTDNLTDERILSMLSYNYGQYTCNRARLYTEMRIQKRLSRASALFVTAGYQKHTGTGGYGADCLQVAAGLCF